VKDSAIIDILLFDEDISESRMWLASCLEKEAYKHPNFRIRKYLAMIIKNLMKAASQRQL
jgi:hypothetical protein